MRSDVAKRPVFIPVANGNSLVKTVSVEFAWYPGMSWQQKQKCIESLHASAARDHGLAPLLEISTKSRDSLGVKLSAFNLMLDLGSTGKMPVEVAFQGSKVFERGGPYTDLYGAHPREAKKDDRLNTSGNLVCFKCQGQNWPLNPLTSFYDWLYLNALRQNLDLATQLLRYCGFTDIEFNPERSINCQARSAATYVALVLREELDAALASQESFLRIVSASSDPSGKSIQLSFACLTRGPGNRRE